VYVCADKASVGVRPEDDILEQWRRRRRLEIMRQRVVNSDSDVLLGTSQRLVQPQVCNCSSPAALSIEQILHRMEDYSYISGKKYWETEINIC